jgi:hypothetical protein
VTLVSPQPVPPLLGTDTARIVTLLAVAELAGQATVIGVTYCPPLSVQPAAAVRFSIPSVQMSGDPLVVPDVHIRLMAGWQLVFLTKMS